MDIPVLIQIQQLNEIDPNQCLDRRLLVNSRWCCHGLEYQYWYELRTQLNPGPLPGDLKWWCPSQVECLQAVQYQWEQNGVNVSAVNL